jgi:L-rhamnose mutarotase
MGGVGESGAGTGLWVIRPLCDSLPLEAIAPSVNGHQEGDRVKKRTVHMGRIKPECLEAYKEYHRHVWPELEAVYRKAGFTELSCFLKDNLLLIYLEYDDSLYPASGAWLDKNEVQVRWQALMKPLGDPEFQKLDFEEVYRM